MIKRGTTKRTVHEPSEKEEVGRGAPDYIGVLDLGGNGFDWREMAGSGFRRERV